MRIGGRIPRYELYHFTSQNMSFLVKERWSIVTCLDIIPYVCPNNIWEFHLRKFLYSGLSRADRIIAISEHTKNDLIQHLGIPREKIKVIPLAAGNNFIPREKEMTRKQLGLPPDKKILLHVGTKDRRKNVASVLKVFFEVQKRRKDLILVRVGSERKENFELAERLGLMDKIVFTGFVSLEKFPLYYNAADLLIFPSLYEGFGLPLLEAMSSGCPVIASNSTSLPEVIGEAGILLDPFDFQGMAEKIVELLEDTKLKEELIRKGLDRARSFAWEKVAKETWQVYQEVVGG